jgi:flagellar protein FlbD
MIRLTRINQKPVVLNADLIEHVEVTPDTVICMTTGQKFVVLEGPETVIERVVEFRRAVGMCLYRPPSIVWRKAEPAGEREEQVNEESGRGL